MKLLPLSAICVVLLAVAVDLAAQQHPSHPPNPTHASQAAEGKVTGNVEHGRYLVERVVMCYECHSPRDEDGNIIQERRFEGGPIPFRPPWPNDWAIEAPRNKGLPGYTEEQGIRLLTEGAIGRDGNQLRLPMPRFHMTRQDAADVVAYFKSME
jgi:hypothetical protein